MQNARLDEAKAGIKIARRNINNLGYADDITLMAESKELDTILPHRKLVIHLQSIPTGIIMVVRMAIAVQ